MLNPAPSVNVPKTATYKLRISYITDRDLIAIEHFGSDGKLLSECRLTPEDALDYSKSITSVCDEALGVE
jgi:hypothetical protein